MVSEMFVRHWFVAIPTFGTYWCCLFLLLSLPLVHIGVAFFCCYPYLWYILVLPFSVAILTFGTYWCCLFLLLPLPLVHIGVAFFCCYHYLWYILVLLFSVAITTFGTYWCCFFLLLSLPLVHTGVAFFCCYPFGTYRCCLFLKGQIKIRKWRWTRMCSLRCYLILPDDENVLTFVWFIVFQQNRSICCAMLSQVI